MKIEGDGIISTFKGWKSVEKHLNAHITGALSQECAEASKQTMQEKVEEMIYSHTPKMYQHRGSSGMGLGDPHNMVTTLVGENVLEVQNIAKVNPIAKSDGSYYNNAFPSAYGLAEIVEFGNSNGIISNPARPFVEATVNELTSSNKLSNAMRKGLKRQGENVK